MKQFVWLTLLLLNSAMPVRATESIIAEGVIAAPHCYRLECLGHIQWSQDLVGTARRH